MPHSPLYRKHTIGFYFNPVEAVTTTPGVFYLGILHHYTHGKVVYLRGAGIAGMVPDLVLWGSDGGDNWGVQWNYNPAAVMDQTFSALQSQWHVNMIRVFVYPSWYYRDGIVPSQEDASSSLTTPISTRSLSSNFVSRGRQIRNLRRHRPIHADAVN